MDFDTIVIGAGAAGMMCAAQAPGNCLVIEHAKAAGEKIRISGGGRCNFTNLYTSPENLFESLIYERDNIDKFSLIVDNYIELEQYLSGVSLSNGLNFGLVYLPNSTNEIFGYVRYVNNGSEADLANINRGDIFRSIDDIPLSIDNYSNLCGVMNIMKSNIIVGINTISSSAHPIAKGIRFMSYKFANYACKYKCETQERKHNVLQLIIY